MKVLKKIMLIMVMALLMVGSLECKVEASFTFIYIEIDGKAYKVGSTDPDNNTESGVTLIANRRHNRRYSGFEN